MTNEEIESRVKFLLHDLRKEFPHFGGIFDMLIEEVNVDFPVEGARSIKIVCLLSMLHKGLRMKFVPGKGHTLFNMDGKIVSAEPIRVHSESSFIKALLRELSNNSGYLQRTDRICPTVNKGTMLSLVTGAVSPVQPDLSGLFKYLESRGVEVKG